MGGGRIKSVVLCGREKGNESGGRAGMGLRVKCRVGEYKGQRKLTLRSYTIVLLFFDHITDGLRSFVSFCPGLKFRHDLYVVAMMERDHGAKNP